MKTFLPCRLIILTCLLVSWPAVGGDQPIEKNCGEVLLFGARKNSTLVSVASLAVTGRRSGLVISPRAQFTTPVDISPLPKSTLSPDGRYVVSSRWMNADEGIRVVVQDATTGRAVLSQSFRSVDHVQFLPDSDLLVVNGYRDGDERYSRPHLLGMDEATDQKLIANQKSQSPSIGFAGASFQLVPVFGFLPVLVPNGGPRAGRRGTPALDVPGGEVLGTDVTEVIARADLPYVMTVQSSINVLRSERGPRGGMQNRINTNAHIFDPQTLQRFGSELEYDGLVPRMAVAAPTSTLVALWLMDPIRKGPGHVHRKVAAVIDLRDPRRLLFSQELPQSPDGWDHESVSFQWSSGGRELLVMEHHSGKTLLYEVSTNRATTLEGSRATIGGGFLSNDHPFVLELAGGRADRLFVKAIEFQAKGGAQALFELDFAPTEFDRRFSVTAGRPYVKGHWNLLAGRLLAIQIDGQLVVVNPQKTNDTRVLRPAGEISITNERTLPDRIQSVVQISDSILRVTLANQGVFDIDFSPDR